MQAHNRVPDPTAAEVRERCLEIRSTWSESERIRRVVDDRYKPRVLEVTEVSIPPQLLYKKGS